MRYTGHADRCGSRSLSNIVRGRLAFHRRIGGQNNLSNGPLVKPRLPVGQGQYPPVRPRQWVINAP